MRRLLLLSLVTSVFVSCSHDFGTYGSQIDPSTLKDKDPNEVTKEDIQANVANIFGAIDPNQDWNLINEGSISIFADAPLSDIAKVQLLTESPFLNSDAKVLNEAAAKYGDMVTLTYDAPNAYDKLYAACVSSSGEYYVQVFTPGTENLKFSTTASTVAFSIPVAFATSFTISALVIVIKF